MTKKELRQEIAKARREHRRLSDFAVLAGRFEELLLTVLKTGIACDRYSVARADLLAALDNMESAFHSAQDDVPYARRSEQQKADALRDHFLAQVRLLRVAIGHLELP